MVSPVYLLVITITAVFLLQLADKLGRKFSLGIFYAALAAATGVSILWLAGLKDGAAPLNAFVAGFRGPFAIELYLGPAEAFMLVLINGIVLLASVVLNISLYRDKIYALSLLLLMLTGMNGLILSRDLFNIFVFLELLSISTYVLVALPRTTHAYAAGFKYMVAGGIASFFFLIGTAFVYKTAGTLHLDYIIRSATLLHAGPALFLVMAALMIELKPFPANGWALDVYEAGHPGIVSIISTAGTGAVLFVLYKLLPVLSRQMLHGILAAGMVTFLFSNLTALKQENAGRLLGNSSIGQTGLIISAMSLLALLGVQNVSVYAVIAGGLFVTHLFVKGIIFWLALHAGSSSIKSWSNLAGKPFLLFLFGLAVAALSGLPPFPAFWAKWELLKLLAGSGLYAVLGLILLGSLLEIYYLFRWLGYAVLADSTDAGPAPLTIVFPAAAAALLLVIASPLFSGILQHSDRLLLVIPAAGLLFYAIDWLPSRIKAGLTMAATAAAAWCILPDLSGIRQIFGIMFLGGAFIQLIAGVSRPGLRRGLYPAMIMMILSLAGITAAQTALGFFFAWELMTFASYLLILRSSPNTKTPLFYIVFSTGGAFLILAGLLTALPGGAAALSALNFSNPVALYLLLAGLLVKTGAVGVHLWLPGFYSEAAEDVSPIFSSVLSKASIAGMLIFITIAVKTLPDTGPVFRILGWIGGLTAFFGTLMAVFQEDAKRLLAFSSMGQMGYIILAVALVTHIGWLTAVYIAATHLLFKGIMFLSVGGVISRLKTSKMYEMGGMIKRMPLSFTAFLIALIALSGVPPLTGFGGKWLLYAGLISNGWHLLAGLALFSSAVAFLYCYRIIHTVFLGQLKSRNRQVKEASAWYLIPQYLFVMLIMVFSMYPRLLIEPISRVLGRMPGLIPSWQGNMLSHTLGYWNGNAVMMVTMGVFMVPLIWMLLRVRSIQKVKQFNIVFAAERPDRPETTHFAHNFFAHYTKAVGFLSLPLIKRFWHGVGEWVTSIASALRHFHTGNGQTYALQVVLYIAVLWLFMR